ncbi:MAG: O-phosphoseryl-tRNA(Sec) selenium transferase [Candidatus Lokiarchaeota archaeon]
MVDFNDIKKYFINTQIPENMLDRGQIVLNNFLKPIKILFEQKNIPEIGWSDEQIYYLLQTLSSMDTDKDNEAARVGEREARISSKLHLNISGGFCHGVGRSGFLTAPQPKAPGGSIMYVLSNYLAKAILKNFGLPNIDSAIVVPVATGMSLTLTLAALKPDLSNHQNKRKILIPRLDHKSILKSIEFLGLEKKIIEGKVFGDAVRIPYEDIENAYDEECFAILSFTSFFPPREADDIKAISKLAKEKELVHIIINAYGVQSPKWMKLIRSAIDAGRVDAIIQSTDKNFLTPIGGAVIASPKEEIIEKISRTYPGRASATPVVNFLISMLSLGRKGYQELIEEQEKNRKLLEDKLGKLASKIGERVMKIDNAVAVAITLNTLKEENLTALGGALYNLRVTGPRVYNPKVKKFGTCCEKYTTPYIVMNAAIGAKEEDILQAVKRLEKSYEQVTK